VRRARGPGGSDMRILYQMGAGVNPPGPTFALT